MLPVCLVTVLLVVSAVSGDQLDMTRTPNATGPDVVEAVLGILRRSCVFSDTLVYLRRVANVDTQDGLTSMEPFQGGIWRISEADFNATRYSPALQTYRDRILDTLFIQWNATTYEDLTRPLYSALATQLLAVMTTGDRGIPVSLEEQAALWSKGNSSANVFVKIVEGLETSVEFQQNVDIVFVLDSSSSMSDADFEKAKLFIQNAIRDLDVDSGKVRVAVVEYSTLVYPQFDLNTSMSSQAMLQAVQGIEYQAGGTKTDVALQYVHDHVLTDNGARADAAKLIILITDGRSEDTFSTVTIARSLRLAGVTIYGVAVGEYIDEQELSEVVSSPACSYTQRVSNFTDLPAIGQHVVQLAKKGPVVLRPGVYSFSCGADLTAEILPDIQDGITLEIETGDGGLSLYGSASTAYVPSSALYAFNDTVNSAQTTQIYVRDGTTMTLALQNMTSHGCASYFTITVRAGNQIRVGTGLRCVEGGLVSSCGLLDYERSPLVHTANPPSELPDTLCSSSSDSFVAPYPGLTDRYLLCISGKMVVVYCGIGQVYDVAKTTCVESDITPTVAPASKPTPTPYVTSTARATTTQAATSVDYTFEETTPQAVTSKHATALKTTDSHITSSTPVVDVNNTTLPVGLSTTGAVETTHAQTNVAPTVWLTMAPTVETTTVQTEATTQAPPIQTTTAPSKVTTMAASVQPHPASNSTEATFVNPCTAEAIRNGESYLPYPGDETRYIHCSTFLGSGTVGTCDEHKYFSAELKTCLYKDGLDVDSQTFVTNVTNPCLVTGINGGVQFYSYPADVHKFIHCDQYGEAFIQECHDGLFWNDVIKTCVQG